MLVTRGRISVTPYTNAVGDVSKKKMCMNQNPNQDSDCFSVPLSRLAVVERRGLMEEDTPVQEADPLPADNDYAMAPDPAVVDLVLEENRERRSSN